MPLPHAPHLFAARQTARLKPHSSSRHALTCSAITAAAKPLLLGPPDGFNFRAEVEDSTRAIITQHPELADLVHDGTLVVWRRPASYVERRFDGYQEPKAVYLVGTAHVSTKSVVDVQRVIQAVRPDAVVVELCKGRSAILGSSTEDDAQRQQHHASNAASTAASTSSTLGSDDEGAAPTVSGAGARPGTANEPAGISTGVRRSPGRVESVSTLFPVTGAGAGPGSLIAALQRSSALGGQGAQLLRLLLAGLGSTASSALGVQGGGEFAAARRAAEAVGAQLVLGDRPIEITLQRAWDALPWSQRLRLCQELLAARASAAWPQPSQAVLTQQLVQNMQQDDAISAFFRQLSEAYPELPGPLVHERDMYFAWSLRRSKAVCGAGAVVGVVGRGHMRGIVYALGYDSGSLRFSDLVGGKNSRASRRKEAVLGALKLAAETALCTALYLAWRSWSDGS